MFSDVVFCADSEYAIHFAFGVGYDGESHGAQTHFFTLLYFLPPTANKSNFLDNYKKFKDATIGTFEAKTSAIPQEPKHLVQYLLMKNYTAVCEGIL